MAQYDVPDPEDLVPCPYKAWEMIRYKRMPYHLQKCRKTYSGTDFAVCPFNALHEMPRPELRYHMANCKDKIILSQDIAWEKQRAEGTLQTWGGDTSVPKDTWQPPPSTEDWEDDITPMPRYNVSSLRAKDRMKPRPINKAISQMTPVEKRAHLQRLRINYERKKQGLPPLEDDEPQVENAAPAPPAIRPPKDAPSVYQLSMQQQQQKQAAPATAAMSAVFTHSLLTAGIGRGRGIVKPPPAQPLNVPNGLGIGRGMLMQNSPERSQSVTNGHGPASPVPPSSPTSSVSSVTTSVSQEDTVAVYERLMVNLGMGRGLGRGIMSSGLAGGVGGLHSGSSSEFVVPKVPTVSNTPPNYGSDAEKSEDIDWSKQERKLHKKLRGIEVLEKKQASGVQLADDELEKIRRRCDIEQQLESIRLTER